MVTLTAWGKTGLNSVNLIINASILNNATVILNEVPVDLAQIYGLSSISVSCLEMAARKIDYIRITRSGETPEQSYYTVTGLPRMSSGDVAVIPVVQDPILTVGGTSAISVKNAHISRDGFNANYQGKNDLIDPFMVPRYPPRKKYALAFNEPGPAGAGTLDSYVTVIASTVALTLPDTVEDATQIYTVEYEAEENKSAVKVNWSPEPAGSTTITVKLSAGYSTTQVTEYTTYTAGYALYMANNSDVQKAVKALWAMGRGDAILGQYKLPTSLFPIQNFETPGGFGKITKITMNSVAMSFGSVFQNPAALYEDYQGPEADLVKEYANTITFSDRYRIGMISMISGSQQINKAYNTTGVVICVADPRLNGKPYFIMPEQPLQELDPDQKEIDAYNLSMLFSRGIPGGEWESVPMVYAGASGWASQAATTVMRDDMKTQSVNMRNRAGIYDAAGNVMSAGIAAGASGVNWEISDYDASRRAIAKGGVGKYIDSTTPVQGAGLISGGLGLIGDAAGGMLSSFGVPDKYLEAISPSARNSYIRSQESSRELAQYVMDYVYVAPTVTGIPATTWQGLMGNGVIIYVEYPDPEDVRNWAHMQQQFGTVRDYYATSYGLGAITKESSNFVYNKLDGGTVYSLTNSDIPRALAEDIMAALAVGVRFWKILPSQA